MHTVVCEIVILLEGRKQGNTGEKAERTQACTWSITFSSFKISALKMHVEAPKLVGDTTISDGRKICLYKPKGNCAAR
jgi:hypothetical protein